MSKTELLTGLSFVAGVTAGVTAMMFYIFSDRPNVLRLVTLIVGLTIFVLGCFVSASIISEF